MNTQTQDILYIIIIHISSPDFRPTSAGSVTDCFKKAKEPLFFPNLCVQGNDHIYRMVIVEGRCTKLQLLISYIYNHWLTQKYSEF